MRVWCQAADARTHSLSTTDVTNDRMHIATCGPAMAAGASATQRAWARARGGRPGSSRSRAATSAAAPPPMLWPAGGREGVGGWAAGGTFGGPWPVQLRLSWWVG